MIFAHLRLRRRVSLLAAGALEGTERSLTLAHVEACARCRAEHDEVQGLMVRFADDPLRAQVASAEPEIPLPVLVELVQKRIERTLTSPRAVRGWRLGVGLPTAAAATIAVALIVPPLVERLKSPAPAPVPEAPEVSAGALERLERNVAREQAARYLSDAQDVLSTVAASPRDCERGGRRVDVEAESRRSRELLARRTFLGVDEDAVASARPVLEDVEQMLREVASMEDCVRFRDVERLQAEIARRQLLMKMRLMQRELLG